MRCAKNLTAQGVYKLPVEKIGLTVYDRVGVQTRTCSNGVLDRFRAGRAATR
jgi:hypothetical protein